MGVLHIILQKYFKLRFFFPNLGQRSNYMFTTVIMHILKHFLDMSTKNLKPT